MKCSSVPRFHILLPTFSNVVVVSSCCVDITGSANDLAASSSNVSGSPTSHHTNVLGDAAPVGSAPLTVSSSKLPMRLPPSNLVSGLHSFTSLVAAKKMVRLVSPAHACPIDRFFYALLLSYSSSLLFVLHKSTGCHKQNWKT